MRCHFARSWTIVFVAVLTLLGAFAGCTPTATYPPIEGSVGFSSRLEPIPQLMVEGIWYAHERFGEGLTDRIVINLPPRTPERVYERVLEGLGTGRAMTAPDEWAYHVQEVRVRGFKAEVDVIYPRPDTHEMMTVRLKRTAIAPWKVTGARIWRVPIEAPSPHFGTDA